VRTATGNGPRYTARNGIANGQQEPHGGDSNMTDTTPEQTTPPPTDGPAPTTDEQTAVAPVSDTATTEAKPSEPNALSSLGLQTLLQQRRADLYVDPKNGLFKKGNPGRPPASASSDAVSGRPGVASASPPIPPDAIDGPEGLHRLLLELRRCVYRLAKRSQVKDIPTLTGLLSIAVQYERLTENGTATNRGGYEGPSPITVISHIPRPPATPPAEPSEPQPPLPDHPGQENSAPSGEPTTHALPCGRRCEKCGTIAPDGAAFCQKCYSLFDAVPQLPNFCGQCGNQREAGNVSKCRSCGTFYSDDARRQAITEAADANAPLAVGGLLRIDDATWKPVRDGQTIAEALATGPDDI
jgi:hypothetical protein